MNKYLRMALGCIAFMLFGFGWMMSYLFYYDVISYICLLLMCLSGMFAVLE